MESNLLHILGQASLVAKIVLGILCAMSLVSWALMFQKCFSLCRAKSKAIKGTTAFTQARNLRESVQVLGADMKSPLYTITQEGVDEFNRMKALGNSNDVIVANVERTLKQAVSFEMNRIASSTAFLATTANTAPFIGLFGTVWGIMYSFHSIGMMKSASLATVAPGISEALIATAVGLAVAIPATVGYNMFLGMITSIEVQLDSFAVAFLNRVQREITAPHMATHATVQAPAPAYTAVATTQVGQAPETVTPPHSDGL
ncbi:MAG: MotA/TolQ/ExbB proton channel family protein [Pseudomonadota bacterium]